MANKSAGKGKSGQAHGQGGQHSASVDKLPTPQELASFAGLDANTVQSVYDAIRNFRAQEEGDGDEDPA